MQHRNDHLRSETAMLRLWITALGSRLGQGFAWQSSCFCCEKSRDALVRSRAALGDSKIDHISEAKGLLVAEFFFGQVF